MVLIKTKNTQNAIPEPKPTVSCVCITVIHNTPDTLTLILQTINIAQMLVY